MEYSFIVHRLVPLSFPGETDFTLEGGCDEDIWGSFVRTDKLSTDDEIITVITGTTPNCNTKLLLCYNNFQPQTKNSTCIANDELIIKPKHENSVNATKQTNNKVTKITNSDGNKKRNDNKELGIMNIIPKLNVKQISQI